MKLSGFGEDMGAVVLSEMLLCQQQSPPNDQHTVFQIWRHNLRSVMNVIHAQGSAFIRTRQLRPLSGGGRRRQLWNLRDQCREYHKGEIDVRDANFSEHFCHRNASCDICENTFTHKPQCVSFREDELALVESCALSGVEATRWRAPSRLDAATISCLSVILSASLAGLCGLIPRDAKSHGAPL